jgi:hypothetical protein
MFQQWEKGEILLNSGVSGEKGRNIAEQWCFGNGEKGRNIVEQWCFSNGEYGKNEENVAGK